MLPPKEHKTLLTWIIKAWLVAGTLDICSALALIYTRSGMNPLFVFNYIASAVFGKTIAYAEGAPMIIAGFLLHYLIAFIFTVLLFLVYPRIYPLLKNKWLIAVLYGGFVWCVMNQLVVPITRIPAHTISLRNAVENIIILMLAIGLPVSLFACQYYFGKKEEAG